MTTTGPLSGPATLTATGNPSTVTIDPGISRTLPALRTLAGGFGRSCSGLSAALDSVRLFGDDVEERLRQCRFRRVRLLCAHLLCRKGDPEHRHPVDVLERHEDALFEPVQPHGLLVHQLAWPRRRELRRGDRNALRARVEERVEVLAPAGRCGEPVQSEEHTSE